MSRLILDCDDVLLDWLGGFRDWLAAEKDLHPCSNGPSSWNMDSWLGQPAVPFIQEFNASEAFGNLAPRDDAAAVIPMLQARGCDMVVLTACSQAPDIIQRRKMNLYTHFGFVFTDIVCVPLGSSKRPILDLLSRSIYVEDNVGHAMDGHSAGHNTFVMRRSHNRSLEAGSHLQWVDSFYDLLSRFT